MIKRDLPGLKTGRDFTRGEGVLPYISYIGMCRPKGYGRFLSRFGLK